MQHKAHTTAYFDAGPEGEGTGNRIIDDTNRQLANSDSVVLSVANLVKPS